MISLDLPSFIVAVLGLVFIFNPQFASLWKWLVRKVRSRLNPSDFQCELLLWKDFNGLVHSHSGQGDETQCSYCTNARVHAESESCWHSTIALIFNNAWDNDKRQKFARKPPQLPLEETFLQTEARVVLAYFLCTARINSFRPEMLGSSLQYLDVEERDGLTVVHVGRAEKLIHLTREEVERIFAGWPPFYRKTFVSHEGHILESPLMTFDHVRRPGWIVAIGLGRVQPTDVFIDEAQQPQRPLFGFAIQRVLRMLEHNFQNEWRGNAELSKTLESIQRMLTHGQSAEHMLTDSALANSSTVSYPKLKNVSDLTKQQCEALMRVFHTMQISTDDKAIIDPVLGICMERVNLGVAVALKYTSMNRVLKIPSSLQGDKIVYVRSCKREDE